jgi:hypothetical protein
LSCDKCFPLTGGGGGGGTVTSVTGAAPITVGGTATDPVIGISAATTLAAGSMSAADKTKLNALPSALALPVSEANGGFGADYFNSCI